MRGSAKDALKKGTFESLALDRRFERGLRAVGTGQCNFAVVLVLQLCNVHPARCGTRRSADLLSSMRVSYGGDMVRCSSLDPPSEP